MKCDDCLNVIEEYFDAELDAPTTRDVAAHLAACAECSDAYEALKQEQAIYASYRRDVDVTSALWAGIQARIHQEAAQVASEKDAVKPNGLLSGLRGFFASLMTVPRFSPALAAAAIIFAVGATIVVMNYLHSRSAGNQIAQQDTSQKAESTDKPEVKPTPAPPQTSGGKEESDKVAQITSPKGQPADEHKLPTV